MKRAAFSALCALLIAAAPFPAMADSQPPLPVPSNFEPIPTSPAIGPLWISEDSLRSNNGPYGLYTTGDVLSFGQDEDDASKPVYVVGDYIAMCEEGTLRTLRIYRFDAGYNELGRSEPHSDKADVDDGPPTTEQVIYRRLCADWEQYE